MMLIYRSIIEVLKNKNEAKARTETRTGSEHESNKSRHNNTENTENKGNTTPIVENDQEKTIALVIRITKWAYGRAGVRPSCSKESFKHAVTTAIEKAGIKPVFKLFEDETNAITFLTNIKNL